MGYRSDVVAVIYPDCASDEQAQELYAQLKVLMNTTFKQLMDDWFGSDAEWIDNKRVLKFSFESVKWYESYPDVRAFTAMVNMLGGDDGLGEEAIGGYCTEFMRVGEDDTDVVSEYNGDNSIGYLSVRREIVCDV